MILTHYIRTEGVASIWSWINTTSEWSVWIRQQRSVGVTELREQKQLQVHYQSPVDCSMAWPDLYLKTRCIAVKYEMWLMEMNMSANESWDYSYAHGWTELWVWTEPLSTPAPAIMKAVPLSDVDHSWIKSRSTMLRTSTINTTHFIAIFS